MNEGGEHEARVLMWGSEITGYFHVTNHFRTTITLQLGSAGALTSKRNYAECKFLGVQEYKGLESAAHVMLRSPSSGENKANVTTTAGAFSFSQQHPPQSADVYWVCPELLEQMQLTMYHGTPYRSKVG